MSRAFAMTAMPDALPDKPALRRLARARRDAIPPDERARAAAAAAARVDLEVFSGMSPGAIIGLYAAMRSELPTDAAAAAALARGHVLVYPLTSSSGHVLSFHRATPAELVIGRFGIPEPPPHAPRVEAAALDAILVPGLLFDRAGYRLGWGGGWYDATLPTTTGALRIGFAYERQVVDELPRAPHDQAVHCIITDAAVHHAGAQGP
jgi:5-formyltetrahydrofolate cyclo-ligase